MFRTTTVGRALSRRGDNGCGNVTKVTRRIAVRLAVSMTAVVAGLSSMILGPSPSYAAPGNAGSAHTAAAPTAGADNDLTLVGVPADMTVPATSPAGAVVN